MNYVMPNFRTIYDWEGCYTNAYLANLRKITKISVRIGAGVLTNRLRSFKIISPQGFEVDTSPIYEALR
jgi:hypothetical protein